jgi:hypothetical protein
LIRALHHQALSPVLPQGLGYYSTLAKNQSLALHDQLLVTLITGASAECQCPFSMSNPK